MVTLTQISLRKSCGISHANVCVHLQGVVDANTLKNEKYCQQHAIFILPI